MSIPASHGINETRNGPNSLRRAEHFSGETMVRRHSTSISTPLDKESLMKSSIESEQESIHDQEPLNPGAAEQPIANSQEESLAYSRPRRGSDK